MRKSCIDCKAYIDVKPSQTDKLLLQV